MKKIPVILSALILLVMAVTSSGNNSAAAANDAATENTAASKKIAYISNLGEFLSYTIDPFTETDKLETKAFSDYILIFTCDMDLRTDNSWKKYAPDWQTYGWYARSTFASIEGGGHTIYNLWTIPDFEDLGSKYKVSLIRDMENNFVRNLNLTYDNSKMIKKPEIIPGDRLAYLGNYGGLIHECINSVISNVHVKGNFYLAGSAAGIANWPKRSLIKNCSFEGELMAGNAGGIVAASAKTSIKNCFFKGSIIGVGIGGISDRPRSLGEVVEFSNNLAVITDIQEVDFGIYADHFKPRGTFFGNLIETDMTGFVLKDNYVLNVRDYPHASMTYGSQEEIGGFTENLVFASGEVTGFDEVAYFAQQSNFPGLDFKNYWYMDPENGHPRLKRNFVSIIDLSDKEFDENFIIRTEDRYYNADELSKVEAAIRDKAVCQLTYFSLDGMDVLGSMVPDSLPLFMDSSHILVVKAGRLGAVKFDNLENITSLRVNGSEAVINNSKYSFNYRLGDMISFSIDTAEDYGIKNITANNGYTVSENSGVYTLTTFKTSTLDIPPDIEISVDIQKLLENKPGNITLRIFLYVFSGLIALAGISFALFKIKPFKKKH